MTTPRLGRLERVTLREAWLSESADFTPWLAQEENLRLLAETIGIELEVESTEKNVGPFRADILCKDTLSDSWVLIENQLERTDHSHLGQLLTYAAGLNTVTIVWIAERFTDEHRAALDWLNEVTEEGINFFGLEIELWRIGVSDIAPKFNVISQPNNWTKRAAAAREVAAATSTDQLKLAFWTGFQRYLEDNRSFLKSQKPSTDHWTNFALGRSHFVLMAVVGMRDGYLGVSMIVTGPYAKAFYHLLFRQKAAIESEIGESLEWRELPNNKQSDAQLFRRNVDPTDAEQWPQYFEWLRVRLEAFHRAFSQRVRQLNATDYIAPEPPEDSDIAPL